MSDTSALPHSADTVHALVARVLTAPGERELTTSRDEARALYGFEPPLLDALIAAGLPCRGDGPDTYFAAPDLHFLGMHLGVGRAHLAAARMWLQTFERLSGARRARFGVEFVPQTGRLPDGTEISVLTPDGRRVQSVVDGTTVFRAEVTTSGDWPRVPPAVAAVVDRIAEYDLYLREIDQLPDVESARLTKMADCRTATALFIDECEKAGFEARTAYGLLLSEPFSLAHVWPEVRTAGQWIPVDPLILGVHRRFSGLSASSSHSRQSPGVVLHRIASDYEPLLTVAGAPIPVTVLATLHETTPSEARLSVKPMST